MGTERERERKNKRERDGGREKEREKERKNKRESVIMTGGLTDSCLTSGRVLCSREWPK